MEQLSPCSKFGCGDPQCDLCYKVDPSKCDMCGEPYDQDDPATSAANEALALTMPRGSRSSMQDK